MTGVDFTPVQQSVIEDAFAKALFACREQILTDCNFFVRVDQGTLRDTSFTEFDRSKLTLSAVWNTPYAKRVYYTGTPSTDQNANASLMWAEKAQGKFGNDWQRIIQKGMKI